jgi:histidine triad (HIT) family protein
MESIFSKIARGEIPSYKVAESDKYYAFLDINPLIAGHTLVIPKEETDWLFDLSDSELSGLMTFAKRVATALKKTLPERRVGMAVIGFDVPHAHIHLVPMQNMDDIDFKRARVKLSNEEFKAIAESIAENYNISLNPQQELQL